VKIIVGITGASGSIYAYQLITKLLALPSTIVSQIAIVYSETGRQVWDYELNSDPITNERVSYYKHSDFFAPIASGSAQFAAMVVVPCSMGTLGKIASGTSNDLLIRAADVMLKERRKLIIVPREAPLNLIHIENFKTITLAGGIIIPASPSFYSKPQSIEELVNTVIDRIVAQLGIEIDSYRWGGRGEE